MRIILPGNKEQIEELTIQGINAGAEIIVVDKNLVNIKENEVDACIDLLFDDSEDRIKQLTELRAKLIIVNSVLRTLDILPPGFIRINGWNTFLKRPVVEAAGPDSLKEQAQQVLSFFNKKVEWVPDIAGFISSRVIASIINEAYFALGEKVSTKEEIDIAMKLGTNYPYGPFEWSEKIGLKNVFNLLHHLSSEQKRYEPAGLLASEANL